MISLSRTVIALVFTWVIATGVLTHESRAQAAAGTSGPAGVHVMVFPALMFPPSTGDSAGEDHVTFTYPRELSDTLAMRDFLSYSKVASRTLHDVQVTTARTPLDAGQSPRMTCVTFTTPGLIRSGGTFFDIEPFIVSLKNYKRIRISFLAPPGFDFTGLRAYRDKYVDVKLDQLGAGSSTTYTYDVTVADSSFTALRLPTWQADPAQEKIALQRDAGRRELILKIAGFLLVGGVAVAAGYFVYSTLVARTASA